MCAIVLSSIDNCHTGWLKNSLESIQDWCTDWEWADKNNKTLQNAWWWHKQLWKLVHWGGRTQLPAVQILVPGPSCSRTAMNRKFAARLFIKVLLYNVVICYDFCCFLKRRACSYQPRCTSLYCHLCIPVPPLPLHRFPFTVGWVNSGH